MRRSGEAIAPTSKATVQLDQMDREIINILTINSRTPLSQIAKALDTSPERITYRLNRLMKEKIILDTFAVIDPKKLGIQRHCVYLQFHAVSQEKMKKIIEGFMESPWVNWIIETAGKWELILMLETRDDETFDRVLADVLAPINNYLNDYAVTTVKNFVHKSPRYIGNLKRGEEYLGMISFPYAKELENPNNETYTPDSMDIHILKKLRENARASLTEIGKEIGLARETVDQRIKKLIQSEIITGFIIRLNYHLLNYQYTSIMLKLRSTSIQRKNEFFQKLYEDERFYALMEQIGPWDVSLMMFFAQPKDLREFLITIKENFSDIIQTYETALHFNQYCYTYLSEGVYNQLLTQGK